MNDKFYRAFEDKYRGSREVIKKRLEIYFPFIKSILDIYQDVKALDIGCGRGEWLELLTGISVDAIGIDLDKGMLEACHTLGLPVVEADAFKYLSNLPNESQHIISAFHVVEHISFEELSRFITDAFRVLKPGGLLIMETPNPESLIVATRNFYLDPTHVRPIPPLLLSFVTEQAGFERVKVLRLQEPKNIYNKSNITLFDIFTGASPDYAVVARKATSVNDLNISEEPFDKTYGFSSEDLMYKWDCQFEQLEQKVEQNEMKIYEYQQELMSVYTSTSWKITKPIRFIKRFFKK